MRDEASFSGIPIPRSEMVIGKGEIKRNLEKPVPQNNGYTAPRHTGIAHYALSITPKVDDFAKCRCSVMDRMVLIQISMISMADTRISNIDIKQ
jgi:hypothetical protein